MIAGIILAAGKGTRIKSKDRNKVTLPFLNKPLILYAVELFEGIADKVIVVIGAFHESVKQVLRNCRVDYAYQRKRLGTAHATKVGLDALKKLKLSSKPSAILVGYADHMMFYTLKTAAGLVDYHKKMKAKVTIVTTDMIDPKGYGRIIKNKEENVDRIVEEKDANEEQRKIKEINAGLYCFDYGFLIKNIDKVKKSSISKEYYLTDLIFIARNKKEKVAPFKIPFDSVGIGVNKLDELKESQKIYLNTRKS